MPDTKISALTDGLTFDAGDRIPVARSPYGATDNRYIIRAYLKAYFDTLYDVLGGLAAHEAAGDPHSQYALESALGSLALVSNLTGIVTSVGAATAIADAALSIAKTNGLQAALDGKQPLDTDLTAIAALISAANKLAYATGAGTWALTDFTAVARTLLAAATIQAQRTALEHRNTVSFPSNPTAINPAAGGTAFFGAWAVSTVEARNRIYAEKALTIKRVRLAVIVLGTVGSNEAGGATGYIRVDDTTDTQFVTNIQYDTAVTTRFDSAELNIAVPAGSWYTAKIVFPASFTTAPTTVYHIISVDKE